MQSAVGSSWGPMEKGEGDLRRVVFQFAVEQNWALLEMRRALLEGNTIRANVAESDHGGGVYAAGKDLRFVANVVRDTVADGLASTARVITAAAAIMVVVFGSFLLEDQRIIKVFGVGLSTAVLLDATLVRMLLVPATMELLGERNWWLPKWLDRILPHLNVEGPARSDDEMAPGPLGPRTDPDQKPELV